MFWLTMVPSKFVVKIAPDRAYDGAARTNAPIVTRTHDRRWLCILFLLDFKMMMPTQPRRGAIPVPSGIDLHGMHSHCSQMFPDWFLVLGRPNHASPCVFVVISLPSLTAAVCIRRQGRTIIR